MVATSAFVQSAGFILVTTAVLALIETAWPFFRSGWRRRHLAPNLQLMALTLGLNFAFNAGAILVAGAVGLRGPMLLARSPLPSLAITWIGLFALDGATYACHRLMHRLPALWKVHRVHHSDPVVDVTTALRFHPIETLWRFVFIVVPAWMLGLPAEVVALYRVLSAIVALFEHMNVRLWQPLDTLLSLVIGTPNMHKVHHSRAPGETNTNYGNILSVFDRMLGTFTPGARAASVRFGLDGHETADVQRFHGLLRLPFRRTEPSHDAQGSVRI